MIKVGAQVTKYKTGDIVGVGCISDSDRTCPHCRAGFEQFCPDMTWTYNSPDKHKTAPVTYGGYSESVVIDHDCVLRIPTNLNLAGAAPLLCAGITTYSPLRRADVGPGMKVGVVGLGGLGHMGVKLAKAMGAHVALFTTSESKRKDAVRLGADEVIFSRSKEEMAKHTGTFQFILDCVAAEHDVNAYLQLLDLNGKITLVGAPEKPLPVSAFALLFGNKTLSGSLIGGIAVRRRRGHRKSALGLLSSFPFRQIWRTVTPMSKVFKVSRNFTIRGAKLIHADSAEQAIAIATAEDHPEFFEGRLGSNIGHDVWTHVGKVSSDNEDFRVEEVS